MEEYAVRRLALVLAAQAEIEGMKAYNAQKAAEGSSPAYTEQEFQQMAERLSNLAYAHNDQLF